MFVVTIINPATTGSAACFELGRTGCQKPNSPIRSAFDELCSFGGRRRPHPNGVTASSVVDACSNVSIVVTVCRLDLARVGPTHRRVPQPGAQETDREPPKLAHVRQPLTEVINPAWGFLARSKRGTRPMPAWLFGGTRQRRIQFCASGWEETKEGAAVWWRSPDDRTWL